MKKPTETLGKIETRGDFRQVIESAQQQHEERQNEMERLFPLWAAMAEAYGNAFVNQYGAEPNPTWVAGLSQYTDDQIREGYTKAIADNREFVPNLSVLVGYITNNADWESKRLHKPYDPHAEICDRSEGAHLPPPEDNRSVEEIIAEMRATVGLTERE